MVFSSVHFLFLFLPIVFVIYFITGKKAKNIVLLVASLFFYIYGEKYFSIIMLVSIISNHFFGIWIERATEKVSKRKILIYAVILNLGLLGFFKYTNFLVENINALIQLMLPENFNAIFALTMSTPIPSPGIHLPIGISFFTFQSLSYVIDVYRGDVEAQKKFTSTALFISSFPQLVAGPIVRYHDVAKQLLEREVTREKFYLGIKRFVIGLGKKVLIANTVAVTADHIFDQLPMNEMTATLAWAGLICYAIQLYFDFSGYSDMAIGLGHMFGFTFLENFNYPFISLSIRDHWKRWHISLTNWMRDYLYIPLGGNRGSTFRTYFNLVMIFVVTAFWHGADWHFLLWGLYNGMFMALERAGIIKPEKLKFKFLQWFYAMFVILIGYVLFRATGLDRAFPYIAALFGFGEGTGVGQHLFFHIKMEQILALIAGIIGSGPIMPYLDEQISTFLSKYRSRFMRFLHAVFPTVKGLLLLSILLLCIIKLSAGTYNPFIYFTF